VICLIEAGTPDFRCGVRESQYLVFQNIYFRSSFLKTGFAAAAYDLLFTTFTTAACVTSPAIINKTIGLQNYKNSHSRDLEFQYLADF